MIKDDFDSANLHLTAKKVQILTLSLTLTLTLTLPLTQPLTLTLTLTKQVQIEGSGALAELVATMQTQHTIAKEQARQLAGLRLQRLGPCRLPWCSCWRGRGRRRPAAQARAARGGAQGAARLRQDRQRQRPRARRDPRHGHGPRRPGSRSTWGSSLPLKRPQSSQLRWATSCPWRPRRARHRVASP